WAASSAGSGSEKRVASMNASTASKVSWSGRRGTLTSCHDRLMPCPQGPGEGQSRPRSVPCYLSWSAHWASFYPAVRLMGRAGILYSRGNRSDEGSSVRKADVREVQGDPPQWRGPRHLLKPATQAASGLGRWHVSQASTFQITSRSRSASHTSSESVIRPR